MKGNPVMLVAMFFGAAVLSMGGLYALIPSLTHGPTIGQLVIAFALSVSLGFSVLIVGRVFWVVGRQKRVEPSRSPGRRSA